MKRRRHVNKRASARKFTKQHNKTRLINIANPPMRGGIRL